MINYNNNQIKVKWKEKNKKHDQKLVKWKRWRDGDDDCTYTIHGNNT